MIGKARGLGGRRGEDRFLKNARIRMVEISQMRKKVIYSRTSAMARTLDDEEGNVRFLYDQDIKSL